MLEIIAKYFPNLTATQCAQFEQLPALYAEWNAKINCISRRDIENITLHHILHSIAIAKVENFRRGTSILDVGTGGGFPGIPLAIMFPDVKFHLIDSIGKKIRVATAVANAINLQNVQLSHKNVIEEKGKYDFIVTRAVMSAADLIKLTYKNINNTSRNALHNGILTLKGGNLEQELQNCTDTLAMLNHTHSKNKICIFKINDFFAENYFNEKYVIHIPI